MLNRKNLLALFTCAALSAPLAAQAAEPPSLDLKLKPVTAEGQVDHVDVRLRLQAPAVAEGGTLVRMPLIVASIPTARYDGDAIQARDDAGPLVLTQKDEPPTPSGTYRSWIASRATQGDVEITYKAKPRAVGPATRPGPLFDLRAEAGGLNGAGLTFLALPYTRTTYRIHIDWDLSAMPVGSRAAWSSGDGAADKVGPAELLANTYYTAGPLKRFPEAANGPFALYWLSPPSFDTTAVAERIQRLYGYMSGFFQDLGGSYRVFVRKNPYRGGGGTALTRSFMFGYSADKTPTVDDLQGLLAHEMVHNWPAMDGEHGDTAWYSEGAAEYYSIVLSYRAGLLTPDRFLEQMNGRAAGYYTNPLRPLSNAEAGQRFWSDNRAQTIPYGRGVMYLIRVDAQIRSRSGGKRSLDDLVLAMLKLQREGNPHGVEQWLALVEKDVGPAARPDYKAMTEGSLIVPPADAFGSCLRLEKHDYRALDLGFDPQILSRDKGVHGLDPKSNAAQAGLRDGDKVISSTGVTDLQKDQSALMKVQVERDGGVLEIRYAPRGPVAPGYQWARQPGKPDSACRF